MTEILPWWLRLAAGEGPSFDFLNPYMLLALSAFLIPIIIEWLFRKRRRQIELPTIRFLLRNKEQEKIKRQDRLLLILRILALILLALILTRPLIRHGLGGARERNVIVFIDNTASMNQSVGTDSAFGWATRKAAEMIRELPRGATISVGYLSDRAETLEDMGSDIHTASAKVQGLRPGSGAAPMQDALAWIKAQLAKSKKSSSEIYLFSDFQKSTWIPKGATASDISKAVGEISRGNELYLVDVGGEAKYNFFVTGLRPTEWVMSARMPVTFRVTIDATGNPPRDKPVKVTLLVNGKEGFPDSGIEKKGYREILPTGGPITLDFDLAFQNPGEYLVEAAIEADGDTQDADNHRRYICDVQENLQVLILDETAENPVPESIFLARAVAPPWRPGMTKVSRFATKTVHPLRIVYENLGNYIAVVLTGSGTLREDMVSKLEQYVADGGALCLFMGDRINPYEYNKLLYKKGAGLMPCAVKAKASPKTSPDGPDALVFDFDQKIGNRDGAVWEYMALDLKPDAAEDPPASGNPVAIRHKLSNGDPAVVQKSFGRGKVLLNATSAGVEWTFLPARPEFIDFVQDTLRDIVGDPNEPINLRVGGTFRQPVGSMQQLLLYYPDGRRTTLTPRPDKNLKDTWQIDFSDTTQSGRYLVDAVPEVLTRRHFVVNQTADEADLARLTQGDFGSAFGSGGWTWISQDTALPEFVASLHTVTEMAPGILWVLMAVLAVESFLAARFGRRRGGTTP